ncbi:MAG: endonuclease/exonuclease/phosphatase family protein [bacterium]
MKRILPFIVMTLSVMACSQHDDISLNRDYKVKADGSTRIATFNISFYREGEGGILEALRAGDDDQIQAVAKIIKAVDPDIILLNEIDWDNDNQVAVTFRDKYLDPQNDGPTRQSSWPYIYVPNTNTGLSSGADLDGRNGAVTQPGSRGYGNDAFGFGTYPGQYGMAILSKYPIYMPGTRTFQTFLWKDMPDNMLPTDYYSQEAQNIFRLSSKNHADIAIAVGKNEFHLLASHPTPPTFDGKEDRNGRRNHDEIRFWADYIDPQRASYIYDDDGTYGPIKQGVPFIIAGDMNADPFDGDSRDQAIHQLLTHSLINAEVKPISAGAMDAAERQGGANAAQAGPAAEDTADFRDDGKNAIGNLHLDYLLPSQKGLKVVGAGVFWPAPGDANYELVGKGYPVVSSDHRLVWMDIIIEDQQPPAD